MSSELSREEIMLPVDWIRMQAKESPNYMMQALHQIADNFDAIHSALTGPAGTGGGGGEAVSGDGRKGDAYFWRTLAEVAESRLAAAEKERDELRARLVDADARAAMWKTSTHNAEQKLAAAEKAAHELKVGSVHIDMAGIYVDGVKYTPEQVRSVVRRLATIRDAAGAQP